LLAKMQSEGLTIPFDVTDSKGVKFKNYNQIIDWVCQRQKSKSVRVELSGSLRRYLQIAGLATFQGGKRVLHKENFSRHWAVPASQTTPMKLIPKFTQRFLIRIFKFGARLLGIYSQILW
jgi:hypothetical protein